MLVALKVIVALGALWAAVALTLQVRAARGDGRVDHSRRAGSPARGVAYAFTVAMTPRHKESVGRHPFAFAVGVLMHAGVILSILAVLLMLVWPAAGATLLSLGASLLAPALAAGLGLLFRRMLAPDLRVMSVPDDYLAILATCGLLAVAMLCAVGVASDVALLIYTALLFVYLPLGKLRHAVFFFVARADLGRRLGYRGVYPAAGAALDRGR